MVKPVKTAGEQELSVKVPISFRKDQPRPELDAAAEEASEPQAAPGGADEPMAAVGPGTTAGDRSIPSAEALQQERDELYDRLLRKTAEFENYRKRVERERRELTDVVTSDLVKELLPIIDNFERAQEAAPGREADAYREGVAIIHRQLLDLLRRWGVRPIEAVGADFDPHLHEAVVQEFSPNHRDGEVIEELQRGYRLGDRLLRPAMVKVAKA
jgi:molecular chaperone GrpE